MGPFRFDPLLDSSDDPGLARLRPAFEALAGPFWREAVQAFGSSLGQSLFRVAHRLDPPDLAALSRALGAAAPSLGALSGAHFLPYLAVLFESRDALRLVLAAGAPPCGQALALAALSDRADLCEALLGAGADPHEAVDGLPLPPLAIAASRGAGALGPLRLFLDWGADPGRPCPRGRLPLSVCQTVEAARALIQAGADPAAIDRHGMSASDCVRSNPHASPDLPGFLESAIQSAALRASTPRAPSTPSARSL